MPKIRDLLIPRKTNGKAPQPDYGTDMRAIEFWANHVPITELVAGTGITLSPADGQGSTVTISSTGGGGGGYASLTGPGQTVTPGALTQRGDFTISNGVLTQGGANVSLGNSQLTVTAFGGSAGVSLGSTSAAQLSVNGSGGVSLSTQLQTNPIQISALDPAGGGWAGDVIITTAGGNVTVSSQVAASGHHGRVNIGGGGSGELLAFFGATGAVRQPAGTTLASLIAALQAYGLVT